MTGKINFRWFKQIRLILQWKYVGWIIATLIGVWSMMIELQHRFLVGYFCVAIWTLLAIGAWLTSEALRKARPTKKELRKAAGKQSSRFFILLTTGGTATIMALGVIATFFTLSEQQLFELSQYKGVLFPASDSDAQSRCNWAPHIPSTPMRFFLGGTEVAAFGKTAAIVVSGNDLSRDHVFLGIDRMDDESLVLNARVLGDDGKVIALIDRNHFEINRNMILDSLSPPRPDPSTIVIKDQHSNKLRVRFMNPHSLLFEGRFYVRKGRYVQFDSTGILVATDDGNEHRYFKNLNCLYLSNPEGGGFIGID